MTGAHGSTAQSLWIWIWLAALMLLSVVLSESSLLPISSGAVVWLVLVLSTVKALLVALYYMHLKDDRRLVVGVALFPLILIGLATLLVLSGRLIRL